MASVLLCKPERLVLVCYVLNKPKLSPIHIIGNTFQINLSNFLIRGSGVLPKGQHSWNISVMKEARVDPKIVLELSMKCPSLGIFSYM